MKTQNIITILLLIVFISSCDNSVDPEENIYHNKILFTSGRSGKHQLYMMNPDGTGIEQLTNGEFSHSNGRWSPDASKIVYNTDENLTTAGLQMVVMNSDGTNRELLGIGSQMSWNSNGYEILFSDCPSCEIGILGIYLYLINIESFTTSTIIIEGEGGSPEFSADGKKIIYTQPDYASNPPNSKTKVISYPDQVLQTVFDSIQISYPSWSPDGNQIVFSQREVSSEPNDNIYTMNIDGSNLSQITNNKSNMPFIYPRWSPDGKRIIFLAYTVDWTQKWYLYMIDKDGSNMHKVLEEDTITSIDWSK